MDTTTNTITDSAAATAPRVTRYFLDTEFIDDGRTIDLVSIALVAGDGREFYRQCLGANFVRASDWVWRHVFPHLQHFDMCGKRSCQPTTKNSFNDKASTCHRPDCPWRSGSEIRDELREFCNPAKYGTPEFWGYFCAYDWAAFCQLFGAMHQLPGGFPFYCRDLRQWLDNHQLQSITQLDAPHDALRDAQWIASAWRVHVDATRSDAASAPPQTFGIAPPLTSVHHVNSVLRHFPHGRHAHAAAAAASAHAGKVIGFACDMYTFCFEKCLDAHFDEYFQIRCGGCNESVKLPFGEDWDAAWRAAAPAANVAAAPASDPAQ